jgi:hypothetical protein
MPISPLPEPTNLEELQLRAKRLYRGVYAQESEFVAAVREFHPGAEAALAAFALGDAQLVLARSHGFASWTQLRRQLQTQTPPT